MPGTFASWFRTAYRSRAIVADGTATFAGKRAARFQSMAPASANTMVFWRPGARPPRGAQGSSFGGAAYLLIDWYIDPATAQPMGFKTFLCTSENVRSCQRPASTTRIATFQRLDPTPQHIALLTGPNAPAAAR